MVVVRGSENEYLLRLDAFDSYAPFASKLTRRISRFRASTHTCDFVISQPAAEFSCEFGPPGVVD